MHHGRHSPMQIRPVILFMPASVVQIEDTITWYMHLMPSILHDDIAFQQRSEHGLVYCAVIGLQTDEEQIGCSLGCATLGDRKADVRGISLHVAYTVCRRFVWKPRTMEPQNFI